MTRLETGTWVAILTVVAVFSILVGMGIGAWAVRTNQVCPECPPPGMELSEEGTEQRWVEKLIECNRVGMDRHREAALRAERCEAMREIDLNIFRNAMTSFGGDATNCRRDIVEIRGELLECVKGNDQ